jgi:hypothetical protein
MPPGILKRNARTCGMLDAVIGRPALASTFPGSFFSATEPVPAYRPYPVTPGLSFPSSLTVA